MLLRTLLLFVLLLSAGLVSSVLAQETGDSLIVKSDTTSLNPEKSVLALDTTKSKKFNPRKATLRSAILPGWGQAYNKKYWKIPIVYGALGVSAGIFFFNLKTYKELRQAVIYRLDDIPGNDTLITPELIPLSTESLRIYRNAFRQNIDYSVLAFLALWGLNVVDATVDAQLKAFNVSPSLSLKIKPSYDYFSRTTGISLVFHFRDKSPNLNLPR